MDSGITIYPTIGFTLHSNINIDVDNFKIGLFIKKDNKYELRGLVSEFKEIEGKKIMIMNIQLDKNENDYIIILYTDKNIKRGELDSDIKLQIGSNNLSENLDNIPTIIFNSLQ